MDRVLLVELVEASDVDALIRFVDGVGAARDWDGLVEVRDRCREAVGRGKQLWGVAEFAEYRMALEAPARFAGAVVLAGAGRHALGPFWEVAASTHTWDELADHIPAGPARTMAAHERVIRGEALAGDPRVDPDVLEVPLVLADWEPAYPPAVYRPDKADFPEPDLPPLQWVELPAAGERRPDPVVEDALHELVRPWEEQSNGRVETVGVAGTALAAVAALGPRRVRAAELTPAEAVAHMAWTGASGGAYGRRRGTPVGRHDAWWVVAALAGALDDWPLPPDEVGEEAAALRWWRWDPGDQTSGWAFHLAVADPDAGRAWAITAADAM